MNHRLGLGAVLLACVGLCGCVRDTMIGAQAEAIRDASKHGGTMHDYETARVMGRAGMGQLEGMYALSPGNEDVLFLLARGWAGVTFAFTLDDYERALVDGDPVTTEYELARTSAGFARARFYGIKLLERHADGFAEARKNGDSLAAWLDDAYDDPEQAEELLWVAFAWLMHAVTASDDPNVVAEMYVGLGLLAHAMKLDSGVGDGAGHMLLGAVHSRAVGGDLPRARAHFEKAMAASRGRYLPPKLLYATRYLCAVGDRAGYEKTLRDIVHAGDTMPEKRLMNLIAQRRARRYLHNPVFSRNCSFG